MTGKQEIVVLTTGGTIASAPAAEGRNRSGAIAGEELVRTLGLQASPEAGIRVVPALQKPSNAVSFEDLLELRRQCLALAEEPGVAGIVVTHGTDTLEDTAYFLDLTVPTDASALVVTGSQRAPHELGSDAHRNLRDAIAVAGDPGALGLGALVAFNENVYAAHSVRKVHTYQLAGFEAPGVGRVGYVDQGRLYLEHAPARPGARLTPGVRLPRVDVIPAGLDASPALLESALASGAEGIVLEALGRGHVPPTWVEVVRGATAAGVPVVVTSSCLDGPVHRSYEFPGSLGDLEAAGAIPLPGLAARKARIRLATLLSADAAGRERFAADL